MTGEGEKPPSSQSVQGTPLQLVMQTSLKVAEGLSEHQYALSFVRDMVAEAAPKLEEGRRAYEGAKEDALTNGLLSMLYAAYPGVSRETDSSGHVDINLRHPVRFRTVLNGEAKVIRGQKKRDYEWYWQGLIKLVGQYNTGRNAYALMVAYCRAPDAHRLMEAFSDAIGEQYVAGYEAHVPLSEVGLEHQRGVFATSHNSAGAPITVLHVWVNLFAQKDAALLATSRAEAKRRSEEDK